MMKKTILLLLLLFVIKNSNAQCDYSTTWSGSAWTNGVPNIDSEVHFTGNFISNGSMTCCKVFVESNAIVIISSNDVLSVQNEVDVASTASLTFENNSSLYQVNNVQNIGKINYKRNSTLSNNYDVTYWSSPVSGATLSSLSSPTELTNPNYYYYWNPNEGHFSGNTDITGDWVNIPSSTVMQTGLGYIFSSPQSYTLATPGVQHVTFTGIPNNGTYTRPISGVPFVLQTTTNPCELQKGYANFIGNPYPSALDADSFLSDPLNVGIIDGTISFWTHNSLPGIPYSGQNSAYTVNDFTFYNRLGGIGTGRISFNAPSSALNSNRPNGQIAACQGFIINGLSFGNATFNNDMRNDGVGTNNQFFRVSPIERHRIWVGIENVSGGDSYAYKETLVGYAAGATMSYDRAFDSRSYNPEALVNIYSFLSPTQVCEPLNIQGRLLSSPFNTSDFIQLGFTAVVPTGEASQTFKIRGDGDGMFGSTQDYYLTDTHFPGQYFDIKNTYYQFSLTSTTTDNSRFRIVFLNCRTNLSTISSPVSTPAVAGAISYTWTVVNQTTNQSITFTTPLRVFNFTSTSIAWPANFVAYNNSYSVLVSATVGGVLQPGIPCIITTPTAINQINNCGTILNPAPVTGCAPITWSSIPNPLYKNYFVTVTGPLSSNANPLPSFTFACSWNPGSFTLSSIIANLNLIYGEKYSIKLQIDNVGGPELPYGNECIVQTNLPNTTNTQNCGTLLTPYNLSKICDNITIQNTSGATNGNCFLHSYHIRLTEPNGTIKEFDRAYSPGSFNLFYNGITIVFGGVYKVETMILNVGGVPLPYGTICYYKAPQIPTTSLISTQCSNYLVSSSTEYLQAINVSPSACGLPINYTFKLTKTGYNQTWTNPSNGFAQFSLSNFSGLQPNTTYNVQARVTINGVTGNWGSSSCTIITPNTLKMSLVNINNEEFEVSIYPNPFKYSFNIALNSNVKDDVTIKIYDMIGRFIEQKTVNSTDLENELQFGENYSTGIYNVIVTQNHDSQTLRLIKN
jgi:Secretion system C-terminal sorting domain